MSIIQLVAKCTPQEWHVPLGVSPFPNRGSAKGLWIDPVALISLLNGWELAEWALRTARQLYGWRLPKPWAFSPPVRVLQRVHGKQQETSMPALHKKRLTRADSVLY